MSNNMVRTHSPAVAYTFLAIGASLGILMIALAILYGMILLYIFSVLAGIAAIRWGVIPIVKGSAEIVDQALSTHMKVIEHRANMRLIEQRRFIPVTADQNGNYDQIVDAINGQLISYLAPGNAAVPQTPNGRLPRQQDVKVTEEGNERKSIDSPKTPLPSLVRYEDIKAQIPRDHALVGIDGNGIVTRDRSIKALTWVVGGSGTGKTNSTILRIEEDYQWGHYFLPIDPHWFKDDSLYNAIKGYSDRFLMPVASEPEDIVQRLDYFLNEFKRRKSGGSWEYPITIIIDEVGSLVSDKPETEIEEQMIAKIKQVARICGQESRGFQMSGMYISQDAAGLAWLRKRAIMVIAHQLLMMSERLLACNGNTEIARAMDDWPKGRTLIYGIGFEEGQKVYQQPAVNARVVDTTTEPLQSLPVQSSAQNIVEIGRYREDDREGAQEAAGRNAEENSTSNQFELKKLFAEIAKMKADGKSNDFILKHFNLAPGGRNNQNLKAVADVISEFDAVEQ
ncbi:MAG TPA: hypothetical protein VL461_11560 [Dictyobacter sp.]|nr:hypothetical protein [Dictyobacter sp.]